MTVDIKARSISRSLRECLSSGPSTIRVLAAFERACDLISAEDRIVAVVLPEIGDGPLNVVVSARTSDLQSLQPGTIGSLERDALRVGTVAIDLSAASVWDPRPNWETLRSSLDNIRERLPILRDAAIQWAAPGSLLAILDGEESSCRPAQRTPLVSRSALISARRVLESLSHGWREDAGAMESVAHRLAGLGEGLTPAGDDFLAGLILWLWLAHPKPTTLCHELAQIAAPLTTILSAAMLRAAARGECNVGWHRLLSALSEASSDEELACAAQGVLHHGATSGADTLAGFLWTGTCTLPLISR